MLLLPRLPILSRVMLSRTQKSLSLCPSFFSFSFSLSFSLSQSFPRLLLQAERPASKRVLHVRSAALLTYRLPPISYTRNIANRNGRASERARARTSALATKRNCICIRGKLSRCSRVYVCKEPRSSLVGLMPDFSRPFADARSSSSSKSGSLSRRGVARDSRGRAFLAG